MLVLLRSRASCAFGARPTFACGWHGLGPLMMLVLMVLLLLWLLCLLLLLMITMSLGLLFGGRIPSIWGWRSRRAAALILASSNSRGTSAWR